MDVGAVYWETFRPALCCLIPCYTLGLTVSTEIC